MSGLFDALDIHPPELIAVVGSGGKTSTMFQLAHEALGRNLTVITSTTTKIFHPTTDQCELVLTPESSELLTSQAMAGLERCRHITMGLRLLPNGKLDSIPPEIVNEWFEKKLADLVIVEADGARGLSLKTPAEHEPVIPAATTLVIPVTGLSVLGLLLTEDNVFRSELFAERSGLEMNSPITAEAIAGALAHPDGPLRDAPERARIVPVLNQADLVPEEDARHLAQCMIDQVDRIDRVVWGGIKTAPDGMMVVDRSG